MGRILLLLALLVSASSYSSEGTEYLVYRVNESCDLEVTASNGSQQRSIEFLVHSSPIYRFVGTTRKSMNEKRISLIRKNRVPVDLFCRVDMLGNVAEAWLEKPSKREQSVRPQRVKTKKLTLPMNRLPYLGEFRFETTWFTPCGEFADIAVATEDNRYEIDMPIEVDDVGYKVTPPEVEVGL